MEFIQTVTNSWPLVALILGIFALVLFRKALVQLLGRADTVGVAGVKVTAHAQEQSQVEGIPQISKVEELGNAFQSPLLIEVEQNLRKELDIFSKDKSEREKALIKLLATNQIAVEFERTYYSIFGSQLAALQILISSNTHVEPKLISPLYEQAKSKRPDFYGSYSFESWLGFLESKFLITKDKGNIAVTIRGKEFMKYLIDQGYSLKKGG